MAFNFGSTPAPAAAPPTATAPAPSFAFGATTATTPAPGTAAAPGGFTFGGAPAAAAPATPATPTAAAGGGGFSFGGTTAGTAAPASSPAAAAPAVGGGFAFGGTPGAAPAPTTGGFSFGAAAAPTPAAPAPTTGFSFGAAPATPAPTPATGGLFGPVPAASPAIPPQQQQQPGAGQQMVSSYTPYRDLPPQARQKIDHIHTLMMNHRRTMAYVRRMSPALLTLPHHHQGLGGSDSGEGQRQPQTRPPAAPAAFDGGGDVVDPQRTPLPYQISSLTSYLQGLSASVESAHHSARQVQATGRRDADNAVRYGVWPIGATAVRKGILLTPIPQSQQQPAVPGATAGDPQQQQQQQQRMEFERKLREVSDYEASTVDRVEPMPSPYSWQVLRNSQEKMDRLRSDVDGLRRQLEVVSAVRQQATTDSGGTGIVGGGGDAAAGGVAVSAGVGVGRTATGGGGGDVPPHELADIVRAQHGAFLRVAGSLARVHEDVEATRVRLIRRLSSSGRTGVGGIGGGVQDDPFRRADAAELREEQRVRARIRAGVAEASAAGATPQQQAAAPGAPGGGLFGKPPAAAAAPGAPAAGGFNFGAPAPAPTAAAPGGGGLFGGAAAATAPATTATPGAGGGLFGAAPAATAPAPAAGGGLFGTAAPAANPANPGAPAPAAGGFGFGALPTGGATTRSKSKSRSGSRSRR